MIQFHYLDFKTNLPACGASKASHATKAVQSVPQCKACHVIVAAKLEGAKAKVQPK